MTIDLSAIPNGPFEKVAWIRRERKTLVDELGEPGEFHEAPLFLDLASRRGDEAKAFNHLLQMGMLHAQNFVAATQIKLLHLIDGYIHMVDVENPHGIYAVARSLLECSAVLFRVQSRLLDVQGGDPADWQSRGESFFKNIVRARFGTSDPSTEESLASLGVSQTILKPFNIMECLRELASGGEMSNAQSRYDVLCDFVHHNFSNQTASAESVRFGTTARKKGGGAMVVNGGPKVRRGAWRSKSAAPC